MSAEDGQQDTTLKQLKFNLNKLYNKDENLTTNFEPSNDEGVVNKAFLGTKRSKVEGYNSITEQILHRL